MRHRVFCPCCRPRCKQILQPLSQGNLLATSHNCQNMFVAKCKEKVKSSSLFSVLALTVCSSGRVHRILNKEMIKINVSKRAQYGPNRIEKALKMVEGGVSLSITFHLLIVSWTLTWLLMEPNAKQFGQQRCFFQKQIFFAKPNK